MSDRDKVIIILVGIVIFLILMSAIFYNRILTLEAQVEQHERFIEWFYLRGAK